MDQQQHNSNIKALLTRYLQGTATREEKKAVEQWYDTLAGDEIRLPADTAGKERIRASILEAVATQTAPVKKRTAILIKPVFRYAAAICLLTGISALLLLQRREVKPLVWQTGISAIRKVVLPDGTAVTMNAVSTLLVPADFGKQERKVVLSGEAFFEVKQDAAHPFRVSHGTMTTTVLGTSFNIRAYPGSETSGISVVSGRVQVATGMHNARTFILQHHETLQYLPASGEVRQSRQDTALMAQWQSQVLDFNGYTIADMTAALQRQYPLTIVLRSTPADTTRYNISFRKEHPDNILKVLSGLTGFTCRTVDGKIIIHTKTYAEQMK